jgi:hypothetical protein
MEAIYSFFFSKCIFCSRSARRHVYGSSIKLLIAANRFCVMWRVCALSIYCRQHRLPLQRIWEKCIMNYGRLARLCGKIGFRIGSFWVSTPKVSFWEHEVHNAISTQHKWTRVRSDQMTWRGQMYFDNCEFCLQCAKCMRKYAQVNFSCFWEPEKVICF